MRLSPLALCLGLLLSAGPALAQNAETALSSPYGSLTCAEFAAMSPKHRDAIVREMLRSAPPQSLATPTLSPDVDNKGNLIAPNIRIEAPLSTGELIAACQAASPGRTIRDALSADSRRVPLGGN